MPKTAEEIAADNDANREQREALAREANKKRNDALLEARNSIADRADQIKDEEDDLVDLTDEVWDQDDRGAPATKKTRAERIAEAEAEATERERASMTEEERETAAAADLLREQEALDEEQDTAREAGASDSRKNDEGVTEYRVTVAGKVKWLTLAQLRESAGDVVDGDGSGQGDDNGATTARNRTPSPEAAERQRQAEEHRKAEREALRAKLKDLNLRASMGDEQAIDELTDLQLEAIQGDSDRLLRKVDERVDARIVGRTDFQKAVDWFESDDGYADVLTTPRLKAEAARLDKDLASQEPNLSPRERLDRVGNQLRELRDAFGGAPRQNRAAPKHESKLERKRNAPQVPQAAGRTRTEAEPDERETTQQAIARMAASRGQARAIKH